MSRTRLTIVLFGLSMLSWNLGASSYGEEPAGRSTATVFAEYPIRVLAQEAASKPSFFEKVKRRIGDFLQDREEENSPGDPSGKSKANNASSSKSPPAQATRITPPKPVTSPESKNENTTVLSANKPRGTDRLPESADTPGRSVASSSSSVAENTNATRVSRTTNTGSSLDEEGYIQRMRKLREESFSQITETSKEVASTNRTDTEQTTVKADSFSRPRPERETAEPSKAARERVQERFSEQAGETVSESRSTAGTYRPRPMQTQEDANTFLRRTPGGAASSGFSATTDTNHSVHSSPTAFRTRTPAARSTISDSQQAAEDYFSATVPRSATPGQEVIVDPKPVVEAPAQEQGYGYVNMIRDGRSGESVNTARTRDASVQRAANNPRSTASAKHDSAGASSVASPTSQGIRETRSNTSFAGSSKPVTVEVTDDEKALLVSPLLEVEPIGPQRVIVGQESPYRIRLFNRGGAGAEQVVLSVDLPAWVEIQPPEVSAGSTSVTNGKTAADMKTFVWKIDRVEPKSEEQLVLHLLPKERKSFNLKLHYDFKRPSAIAPIEVQEPKLEMALDGPNEVLWGTEEVYKLRIHNTGNGDAEDVKLTLMPGTTAEQGNAATYTIDRLKAGEERVLEVKAWARQNDYLDINVVANGAYDLQSKATRRVNVLRASLDVVVDSPEMLFVGNNAEYTVRVRNIGTAPAHNIEIVATIPLGARYVSNSGSGRATPQNEVFWTADTIPVGGEFTATVLCELKRQGQTKLEVSASDKSGLTAAGQGSTYVESIADLKMKIDNPQGPIEVGSDSVYTITLTNTGTKEAEGIELNAAFAIGIEPIGVEGLGGEMANGQVLFDRIPSISPGQTITVKVKARADQPGNHKIRAEMLCHSTGAHLVHEESTYYYLKRGTQLASKSTMPPGGSGSEHRINKAPENTTTITPLEASPLPMPATKLPWE